MQFWSGSNMNSRDCSQNRKCSQSFIVCLCPSRSSCPACIPEHRSEVLRVCSRSNLPVESSEEHVNVFLSFQTKRKRLSGHRWGGLVERENTGGTNTAYKSHSKSVWTDMCKPFYFNNIMYFHIIQDIQCEKLWGQTRCELTKTFPILLQLSNKSNELLETMNIIGKLFMFLICKPLSVKVPATWIHVHVFMYRNLTEIFCKYVLSICNFFFFFCTVWSTLLRISLTKALVLWWCDNKSDLIWFDLTCNITIKNGKDLFIHYNKRANVNLTVRKIFLKEVLNHVSLWKAFHNHHLI